jgi:cytochrome P450
MLTLTLQHAREQIVAVKSDMDAGKVIPGSRTTIFQELLTPDVDEGYVVPPIDDLKGEAYGILAAAADTTGNAMTVAAQHVVSNPVIYEKLTAELRAAFPDPNSRLDFLTLEKLPYLVSLHWISINNASLIG